MIVLVNRMTCARKRTSTFGLPIESLRTPMAMSNTSLAALEHRQLDYPCITFEHKPSRATHWHITDSGQLK